MSRQAQLGAFALGALVILFGIFFIVTDFATRHNGYRIGVHFASAAGLPTSAQVFFSGVSVGTVDEVRLLPDNTVDVILAIQPQVSIPKDSEFLIQAPLTGTPNMIIVPPVPKRLPPGYVATPLPPEAALPKRILPLEQQPTGIAGATVGDLLQQGQGEIKRLDIMLADFERREPRLINALQTGMQNINSMTAQLKGTMAEVGANFVAMSSTLNSTMGRNQYKIDSMLSSFDKAASSLADSVDALSGLATDPRLKSNLIATTTNVRDLTAKLSGVVTDLQNVTGNAQTQAQLRDTVAQLNATMQKANSLLGALGGQSHVPGVDVGATPYPLPSGRNPLPPPATGTPNPSGAPNMAKLRAGLGHALSNLLAIQLRLGYLNPQTVPGPNRLLSSDRGTQADLNAILLPNGPITIMAGANDIGGRTTANFAAMKTFAPGIRVGGGVLYSQIGTLANFDFGPFGAETRIYNLRRPTFDIYGNLNVNKSAKLFLGQRDATHPQRRTVFGLQLQF